jgi:NodT family efflux transporter outer membrane factor (OMF) lipoprotein
MKTSATLLAGGLLLALAACNLAPPYQRPATDTAAPFKEAVPSGANAAQGWKVADPQDTQLGGRWWELFQDPQLNALEERVAISNQTVVAAEANYRAARALEEEARGALFPTVALVPSVTRSRASASGGTVSNTTAATGSASSASSSSNGSSANSSGAATTTSTSSSSGSAGSTRTLYTLPLEASYEVDLWGKVRNTIAQDKYAAQASAAEVATALLSTHSQLAQDYYQLRAVDEQRRILDTTLGDYQASLHLVDSLYRNGLASDEDLAEADTQLDAAEAQETDLGIARAQYEHAIAVLIGVAPTQFSLAVRPFNPALPVIPVGLPSDLLERRPDISAMERQVAAANAGIGIARAAYFPSLTISAAAGFESTGLSQLFDWPNRFWSIGPSLAETLFEGGARRAATAQARALYDETVANYRQTVLTAFQAVEDNLTSLRILSAEERQQHDAAVAAQREVRLSASRYKLGLDSYVNVITAQNSFLTNREAELQVQVRRVAANINLINNLGGGWDTSQLDQTAKTAQQPPDAGQPPVVPPENAGPGVPNPAPLPAVLRDPQELLQQDEQDMAR